MENNKELNRRYWDKMKRPPEAALKTIKGGRLSGMTDIKPQWRYDVMTEVFGPIGFGWKYAVVDKWLQESADGQICAFADVLVWVKDGDEWSAPIPGSGGSKLISKESGGLYVSDEAYKMAITDALSTALKMLGVGAEIYMGNWDGSKYLSEDVSIGGIDQDGNDIGIPFNKDGTEESVGKWVAKCEEAASVMPKGEFKKWWPMNKAKIMEDCGQAGAAAVYAEFSNMLKG